MSTDVDRIDVHQHMLPPAWNREVARLEAVPHMPDWSPDLALLAMDAIGTRAALLSLTSPGAHLGNDAAARALARESNEDGARVVQDRPDRFGLLAAVPLPDVAGAVQEAVYALDELHADGIGLMSNAGGRYLGDPDFRPLWQVLDNRAATVFVHPTPTAGLADLPGAMGWVDWPFDTTRTAVHMVINGVLRDFPSVKIVLAHAGGFVPYQSGRFEALAALSPGLTSTAVHEDLRRFYFDTALSTAPGTLAALLEFAGPDHVVFGTDFPAAPLDPFVRDFTAGLDTFLARRPELAAPILRETAQTLFPRLSAREPNQR